MRVSTVLRVACMEVWNAVLNICMGLGPRTIASHIPMKFLRNFTYNDLPVEDSVSADRRVAEHGPREVVAVAGEAQGATRYVGAIRMT